jgi:Helicase associated domain
MNNNEDMSLNLIHDDFLVDEDLPFVEADAAPSRAIDKVLDMLLQAQEVVSTDDFDLDLEPTPIGPQAQFVPLQVPSTSCSIPFQNLDVFGCFPNSVPKFDAPRFASSFTSVPTMPSWQRLVQSQTRHKPLQEQSNTRTSFHAKKFRKLQSGQWNERFRELLQFKEEHGHLFVPHSYPPNQQLAQWVKR